MGTSNTKYTSYFVSNNHAMASRPVRASKGVATPGRLSSEIDGTFEASWDQLQANLSDEQIIRTNPRGVSSCPGI